MHVMTLSGATYASTKNVRTMLFATARKAHSNVKLKWTSTFPIPFESVVILAFISKNVMTMRHP